MPVDPQIQALLMLRAALPPMHTLRVEEARAQMAARDIPRPAQAARSRPSSIATCKVPPGRLPLRIYTPLGEGPFPLMVFFHGSGFVVCSLDTHDGMCRNLCGAAGCVVVSVDYRLAPERRFPAAPDDCLAATRWVAENAAALRGDPSRIIVAGDSAGGNLAAVTALRARDEGGPKLIGQMLIYPVTDYHEPGTPSYVENGEGYGLTGRRMNWFWDHYVPTPRTRFIRMPRRYGRATWPVCRRLS